MIINSVQTTYIIVKCRNEFLTGGGQILCDGNYGVCIQCTYSMEWVHNREPERSQVTSKFDVDKSLTEM